MPDCVVAFVTIDARHDEGQQSRGKIGRLTSSRNFPAASERGSVDECQAVRVFQPRRGSAPLAKPVRWSSAIDRALYGSGGFYVAGEGAAGHFRTSASAPASVRAIFGGAVGELLARVDTALDRPDRLDLVDVGGGSGELLDAVLGSLAPALRRRISPTVVERRSRPAGLPPNVGWLDAVPDLTGLLIANEWLDNVAIDVVVENAGGGQSLLLVNETGAECPGPPPTAQEALWLARWWPTGGRRELGLERDTAWAGAVSRVRRGLALAIDYAHTADDRPVHGTLTGFRAGRETDPIPDGSCDLTAHVAIDSVASAGGLAAAVTGEVSAAVGGRPVRTLLTDQRTALRSLGVSGRRPDYSADPGGYAASLQRAGDAAELIDAAGLGAFAWLLQGIDVDPAVVLPLVSSRPRP